MRRAASRPKKPGGSRQLQPCFENGVRDHGSIGKGRTLAGTIDETGVDELRNLIRNRQFSFTTRELLDRVEQFRIENFEIIPAVSELLAAGEIDEIGDLIDLSQKNAERFLGNQIEETVFLQRPSP